MDGSCREGQGGEGNENVEDPEEAGVCSQSSNQGNAAAVTTKQHETSETLASKPDNQDYGLPCKRKAPELISSGSEEAPPKRSQVTARFPLDKRMPATPQTSSSSSFQASRSSLQAAAPEPQDQEGLPANAVDGASVEGVPGLDARIRLGDPDAALIPDPLLASDPSLTLVAVDGTKELRQLHIMTQVTKIAFAKQHHEVLEVQPDAQPEELHRVYCKKALLLHPDKDNVRGFTSSQFETEDSYNDFLQSVHHTMTRVNVAYGAMLQEIRAAQEEQRLRDEIDKLLRKRQQEEKEAAAKRQQNEAAAAAAAAVTAAAWAEWHWGEQCRHAYDLRRIYALTPLIKQWMPNVLKWLRYDSPPRQHLLACWQRLQSNWLWACPQGVLPHDLSAMDYHTLRGWRTWMWGLRGQVEEIYNGLLQVPMPPQRWRIRQG